MYVAPEQEESDRIWNQTGVVRIRHNTYFFHTEDSTKQILSESSSNSGFTRWKQAGKESTEIQVHHECMTFCVKVYLCLSLRHCKAKLHLITISEILKKYKVEHYFVS